MKLTLLLTSIALSTFATAKPDAPAKPRRGVIEHLNPKLDVPYKQVEKKELKLDLYYPEKELKGAYPLVVYTHGGGWAAGNKQSASRSSMGLAVQALTQNGFCVASIQYRLYNKGGKITIKDCVTDCKDGLRYLAKNAAKLHLDPQRICTFGDSAGGQICQMLLLSSSESLPGDPSLKDATYKTIGGVSWYGPCDFEKTDLFNHDGREKFTDRFGARILAPDHNPADKLKLYREMSPINYLTKDSPPLLMIQGDMDTTIPVHHAHYMEKKAKELGAPVSILIVKNAGHNWRKGGDGKKEIVPSRDEIIQSTADFLTKLLNK